MGRPRSTKTYALYKGDDFCMVGTLDEISEKWNKSRNCLKKIATPSYKKLKLKNAYVLYEIKGVD